MQSIITIALFLLGIRALIRILRRPRQSEANQTTGTHSVVSPGEAGIDPYPYVYVNSDGTVRELHSGEKEYLETQFPHFDGGRPYVKSNYSAKSPGGDLKGFCKRSQIPYGMPALPAPEENPCKPMSREELIEHFRKMGMEVHDLPDDSVDAEKPNSK